MPTIFDGRQFASEKEDKLKAESLKLEAGGITPKLVSLLIGGNEGGKTYLDLKKRAAERIGADLEIVNVSVKVSGKEIIDRILQRNTDPTVHGIMIQLPLAENLKRDQDLILSAIAPEKDVDGMRDDSPFVTPVVQAVLDILEEATNTLGHPFKARPSKAKVVVVGADGFVGRRITRSLGKSNSKSKWEVTGVDKETADLAQKTKDADILVSCTGVPGIITKEMVKSGVVLIDVGAPVGDITKEAHTKAAFVSPVPGGVGPVTISCLLDNLLQSASHNGMARDLG